MKIKYEIPVSLSLYLETNTETKWVLTLYKVTHINTRSVFTIFAVTYMVTRWMFALYEVTHMFTVCEVTHMFTLASVFSYTHGHHVIVYFIWSSGDSYYIINAQTRTHPLDFNAIYRFIILQDLFHDSHWTVLPCIMITYTAFFFYLWAPVLYRASLLR